MKRTEKIALLNKILAGTNPDQAKKNLAHALETGSRGLVLIDDLDGPEGPFTDDSTVTFHDKGKEHRMSVLEAHKYAKRNFINTLFVLPANGRD